MADRVPLESGDLLNPAKAEKGRSRIARLGVFDSVQLRYDDVDPETRDIEYDVKEGKSLNLNLLFGFGSYELLRGGVEVEKKNLWGSAHLARLRAIQSFKSTSGDFLYTMPQFIGEEVDLFLNGFGLVRKEIDFTRREYGGGAGGLKHFPAISSDLSMRYNYQVLRAFDVPPAAARGLQCLAHGNLRPSVWAGRSPPGSRRWSRPPGRRSRNVAPRSQTRFPVALCRSQRHNVTRNDESGASRLRSGGRRRR